MIKYFILLLLAAGVSVACGAGTDPADFLSYGTGARSFALGGAYTGIADDAAATYYNSGALGAVQYKEVVTAYSVLWSDLKFTVSAEKERDSSDTNYTFLGYVHPMLLKGALGASIVRLYSGGAEKRDTYNVPQGEFSAAKTAFNLGYGRELAKNIYLGFNSKYINSELDANSISFVSFDAGSFYRPSGALSLGVNIQNVVPFTSGDTDDRLPLNFKLGMGYKLFENRLLFAIDLNKNASMPGSVIDFYSLGFEANIMQYLVLRLGKNDRELSAGFGVKYRLMGFDYAVGIHDYLGMSHRASFEIKFGASMKELQAKRDRELLELADEKSEKTVAELTPEQEKKEEKFRQLYQDAITNYKQGMFSISLEKFEQAIKLLPEDNLIPLYIERLKLVTQVIQQNITPGKTGDLIRRGVSYFVEGDGANSVISVAYALSIEPENFTVERLLNRLEEKTGIKAEKTTATAGLSLVDQKMYESLMNFRKKDYWKVVSICEEIIVLEPENLLAYKRLGSAFYALGEKEKAKQVWQKSLKIKRDPKLEEFIKNMK